MSLKDLVDRIDDKFEAMFHAKKPDIIALRRYVIDRIEATEKGFASPEPVKGRKWFKTGESSTVSFSPIARNGQPLLMNGKSTTFWPSAEFPHVLKLFRAAITKGEFDDQLLGDGTPTVAPKIKGERRPRDLANGSMSSGGGREWSAERRAKFADTIAARKSATKG